jgi:hypothetical protein
LSRWSFQPLSWRPRTPRESTPQALCDDTGLPFAFPLPGLLSEPIKLVQAPRVMMVLFEVGGNFRQTVSRARSRGLTFDRAGSRTGSTRIPGVDEHRQTLHALRLLSKSSCDFPRCRHRAIGISRCRFFLGDRPTAGFVRGVPISEVIEWLLAHVSRRILRRRRARIEWRVLLTLLGLITRRFSIADAGQVYWETLDRLVRRLGIECIRQRLYRGLVRLHSSFQLDENGALEIAAGVHDIGLQTGQIVPRSSRVGEAIE